MGDSSDDEDKREMCKYGANCYRKNRNHLIKFKHPKKRTNNGDEGCAAKRMRVEQTPPVSLETNSSNVENSTEQQILKPEENKGLDYSAAPESFKKVIVINSLESDVRSRIKTVFGMEMPDDFYSFYSFCESISKSSPEFALSPAGIQLVGPYELLSGKIRECTRAQAVLHYRYYFDPPEFQTVLKVNDSELHAGYFRDIPNELPAFVGSIDSSKSCIITPLADNIFSAVNSMLGDSLKSTTPFKKVQINKLQKALQAWSVKEGFTLQKANEVKRKRRNCIAATFHSAGIIVPYNAKTEIGYRQLEEDKKLRSLLEKIVQTTTATEKSNSWKQLNDLLNYSQIANDECDFGGSLELGINLFCFGDELFHKPALHVLSIAYNLLDRELYSAVIQIHLNNRRKGPNVQAIL